MAVLLTDFAIMARERERDRKSHELETGTPFLRKEDQCNATYVLYIAYAMRARQQRTAIGADEEINAGGRAGRWAD